MEKGRDLALLAVLVAAVPFAASAVRLPFDAGFGGECAEDGRPKNWEFHMYEGYLPKADRINLENGVRVTGERELKKAIEDYCS